MYRDASEAAERRIEELEDRVSAQATRIEELQARLDARGDFGSNRELERRTRAPERVWRYTAIALLVALAFTIVYAQTPDEATPEIADVAPPEPTPTLADPVAPRRPETLAETTSRSVDGRCDPNDPLCRSEPPTNPAKLALVAKMENGTATLNELRMLKALCMIDGDTDCRNAAYSAWKTKKDAR